MLDRSAERALLVEVDGVTVRAGETTILANVGLTVRAGEIVSLIGPNGAGKTTLIRVVLGLAKPDEGTVVLRPNLRIGYAPQRLAIDPALPLTVERFLDLGPARQTAGRIAAALAEVGVPDIAARPIQGVSGGEFQRALLARALLRDPELLVLDEPVQGVDISGQADLYRLIGRIRDRRGCGVLLVSHDLHLVMAATDRVVCINRHVCCAGHPDAVSRDPGYVALFGPQVADSLAVYAHHHDHAHDSAGNVLRTAGESDPEPRRSAHRHG